MISAGTVACCNGILYCVGALLGSAHQLQSLFQSLSSILEELGSSHANCIIRVSHAAAGSTAACTNLSLSLADCGYCDTSQSTIQLSQSLSSQPRSSQSTIQLSQKQRWQMECDAVKEPDTKKRHR